MNRLANLVLGLLILVGPIAVVLMLLGTAAAAAWIIAVSLGIGVMALIVSATIAVLCHKIRIALLYPVVGVIAGVIAFALMMNERTWYGLVGIFFGLLASLFFSLRHRAAFLRLADDPQQHQSYVDAADRRHTFIVADDRAHPHPLHYGSLTLALNLLGVFALLALLLFLLWSQGGMFGMFVRVCWVVLMGSIAWVALMAAYAAPQHQRMDLFVVAICGFVLSLVGLWVLRMRGTHVASAAVSGWTMALAFITVLTLMTGAVAFEVERRKGVEIFSQSLSSESVEEAKNWLNRYCPQPLRLVTTAVHEVWATLKELCTVTVRR